MLVKNSENRLLLIRNNEKECWRIIGIVSDIFNQPTFCEICEKYFGSNFATAKVVEVEQLCHVVNHKTGKIEENNFNVLVKDMFSPKGLGFHRFTCNKNLMKQITKQRFE